MAPTPPRLRILSGTFPVCTNLPYHDVPLFCSNGRETSQHRLPPPSELLPSSCSCSHCRDRHGHQQYSNQGVCSGRECCFCLLVVALASYECLRRDTGVEIWFRCCPSVRNLIQVRTTALPWPAIPLQVADYIFITDRQLLATSASSHGMVCPSPLMIACSV